MRVRHTAHALGLRFRLHRKDLPGTPDLVFPKYRVAIFVHGCFWHRHRGCSKASSPKSRTEYWQAKFDANMRRDALSVERLKALGWHVETIWECETKDCAALTSRLESTFDLRGPQPQAAISP
jgi:DNA mismatch endonuclease (patch repair protein)